MRVKTLRIDRHGPLTDFSRNSVGDFTLIYGPNEHGKTLIIDALIKMLFRKEFTKIAKHLGNIQRVAEHPEGGLVLESKGRHITIAQGESISDYLDVDAPTFRNIFVVRDSDVAIVDDVKFYAQLSERLAGLRTSEIERIKRIIQVKGRLTNPSANSDLSKSATAEHAGRRVEAARQMIDEIERKMALFINSDFDRLERRLVEAKGHVIRMRTEIEMLKNAESRERFDKCRHDLDELRRTVARMKRLSRINEEGLEDWKQLDFEKGRIHAELKAVETQLVTNEDRLQKTNRDYAHVRARALELEKKHTHVEEVLRPEMQKCLELLRISWRHKSRASMWRIGSLASLGLLAISMVGSVVHLSLFFYAASVLSLGLLAFSVSRLIQLRRTEWRVRENLEEIRRMAGQFGLSVDSSEDLLNMQNPYERDLGAEQVKLRELEIARRGLGIQQMEQNQKVVTLRSRLQLVDDKVKNLAVKSGTPTVTSYRVALDECREMNTRLKTLTALLTKELGPADPDAMLDVWERALGERFGHDADVDSGLPFDPARVRMLEREVEKQGALAMETDDALNLGRGEMRDLELKITQSGILRDDQIKCRTTKDLENLVDRLRAFIDDMESSVDNAKAAIRLFELIEVEEKSRLVELFGPGKPVSSHFKTMTDGLYDEVCFDITSNEISVLTTDGVMLPADRLSGGALDQLYLAIRVAIAERLLTEPAFFILDDPFVKADYVRVKTQMKVLKRLVQMGWQILYFSAKKEVVEVLADDIRSGQVEMIQLDERLNLTAATARETAAAPKPPENADLFTGE